MKIYEIFKKDSSGDYRLIAIYRCKEKEYSGPISESDYHIRITDESLKLTKSEIKSYIDKLNDYMQTGKYKAVYDSKSEKWSYVEDPTFEYDNPDK